jgi:hypothetical protein
LLDRIYLWIELIGAVISVAFLLAFLGGVLMHKRVRLP